MLRKFFFTFLFSALSLNAFSQRDENVIRNEFLVLINTGEDIISVLERNNFGPVFTDKIHISKSPNVWLLKASAVDDDELLLALKRTPGIIIAQKNHTFEYRVVPNDTLYATSQWNMNNTGQTGGTPGADISAEQAWNITTGGLTVRGDTIIIAVIDCGAYLPHPDINFWKNNLEIPGDLIDNDNNGYTDDYDGWNAQANDGNITSCNHGTHVAGIAGAIGNNNIGVAGVNWNVEIMPVRPSSSNEAFVVGAYSYIFEMRKIYNRSVGDSGAFVVATNSSFGVNFGQPDSFPIWCAMYDSLGSVGILNAGAGPNIAMDVDTAGDMPTGCLSDWLISVTNTNNNDNLSSTACWGDTTIDLGAPGSTIMSTYPAPSDYNVSSGTSMATPHVAGAVALMWAAACDSFVGMYRANPQATALIMKQLMLQNTDTVPALIGRSTSYGRLNLYKALLGVQNYCSTLSVQTPVNDNLPVVVYPNPANNEFTIYNLQFAIESIKLCDALGKTVYENNSVNGATLTVDASDFLRGVYFLNVISENSFRVFKVVVE
jgi:subtilisin family serine protease